jgi:hypothetical protein
MKKIAFVKNGVVLVSLFTNENLFDAFMEADIKIDVSSIPDVESGWTYDGTIFIAPDKPLDPEPFIGDNL